MIARTILMATAALVLYPPQPASAQSEGDPQWTNYQNCKQEYVARGMGDWAAADYFCLTRDYGNQSDPAPGPTGSPERTYYPGPGAQCFGSIDYYHCNPAD